jgi:hypothetical protein
MQPRRHSRTAPDTAERPAPDRTEDPSSQGTDGDPARVRIAGVDPLGHVVSDLDPPRVWADGADPSWRVAPDLDPPRDRADGADPSWRVASELDPPHDWADGADPSPRASATGDDRSSRPAGRDRSPRRPADLGRSPRGSGRDRSSRASSDAELEQARRLARWTDSRFIDPIIGLVLPGLGDLVSAAVGLFIVRVASRRGLPRVVIARMLVNLGIDAAVGSIPFAGDVFDFAWQANRRNVALLEGRQPGRSQPRDWIYVAGAVLVFVAALAAPIALLVWALNAAFG